jgi:protein-S-isoprenylcysteine O-methyltransferase Ste14
MGSLSSIAHIGNEETTMPGLSLGLWVCYLLVSLGLRVLIQLRITGKSGFVLHRSGAGRLQLFASALFVASLLAGFASPMLALALPEHPWLRAWPMPAPLAVLGALLYVAGVSLAFTAQLTMNRSWRIGVDVRERTELVTHGAFRIVRNPVFSALLLTSIALALLCSTVIAWSACVVQLVALEIQVRSVEEPYLASVHGDTYREYLTRVGRFFPGIGRRGKRD